MILEATILTHLPAFVSTEEVSSFQIHKLMHKQRCIYTTRIPIEPSRHVYDWINMVTVRVEAAGGGRRGLGGVSNSENHTCRIRINTGQLTRRMSFTNSASVPRN
jgi:hypothetical protein